MHQDYSESELEEIIDFEEETTAHLSLRQREHFIDDESEDSFRDYDSDNDNVTITYSSLNDLSPPRSPPLSLFHSPKEEEV